MNETQRYTAFAGFTRLVSGDLGTVLSGVRAHLDGGAPEAVLVFDDATGEQVDFDLRGTLEEVLERIAPSVPKKGPGRPSLGVICREVCLLPRHWEWLERQPKRASGTIRRLVEAAQKAGDGADEQRRRVDAVGRLMWSLAGNLEGFEEASRALYAGNPVAFARSIASWPKDLKEHLESLLQPAESATEAG